MVDTNRTSYDIEAFPDFDAIYKRISRSDFRYLDSMPDNFAIEASPPQILVDNKLVAKSMIHSGRNPLYGWMITDSGKVFLHHFYNIALGHYLDKTKPES